MTSAGCPKMPRPLIGIGTGGATEYLSSMLFAMVLTRCSEFHYVNLCSSDHNLTGMDRLFLSVVRPSEVIGIRKSSAIVSVA